MTRPSRRPSCRLASRAVLLVALPVLWACTEAPQPASDLDADAQVPADTAADAAPDSPESRARAAVHWSEREVTRTGDDEPRVRLAWPEPPADDDDPVAEAARGWIQDRMSAAVWGEGDRAASPEAAADAFVAQYQDYRSDFPDAPGGWFLEREVAVHTATTRWVTLSMEESAHTGGAHPSWSLGWVNLEATSGAVLDLDRLVLDDARDELLALLERHLRAELDLGPDAPLTDGGLFRDTLDEPGTFALEPTGIRFLWNPYEIGPWAMGPQEVQVAWDELAPLLRDPSLPEAGLAEARRQEEDASGADRPGARDAGDAPSPVPATRRVGPRV